MNPPSKPPRPADSASGAPRGPGVQPALRSETLLGGATVRVIEHAGQRYQLRLTRNGKLILSK